MRTIEQTTQEILELATKQFKVPAGTLAADDDFYKKLGIDSTPTCYVNGRIVRGFPSPEAYYQVIEEALRASR